MDNNAMLAGYIAAATFEIHTSPVATPCKDGKRNREIATKVTEIVRHSAYTVKQTNFAACPSRKCIAAATPPIPDQVSRNNNTSRTPSKGCDAFVLADYGRINMAVSICANRTVAEILESYPQTAAIFLTLKTHCVDCHLARFCTLEDVARTYELSLCDLIDTLQRTAQSFQKE